MNLPDTRKKNIPEKDWDVRGLSTVRNHGFQKPESRLGQGI